MKCREGGEIGELKAWLRAINSHLLRAGVSDSCSRERECRKVTARGEREKSVGGRSCGKDLAVYFYIC